LLYNREEKSMGQSQPISKPMKHLTEARAQELALQFLDLIRNGLARKHPMVGYLTEMLALEIMRIVPAPDEIPDQCLVEDVEGLTPSVDTTSGCSET
jgi:hypothetical protein